jgi:hypothetical protein
VRRPIFFVVRNEMNEQIGEDREIRRQRRRAAALDLYTAATMAMMSYHAAPSNDLADAAIKAVSAYSAFQDSRVRLGELLRTLAPNLNDWSALAHDAPPEIFWPVFMNEWSICDATWECHRALLRTLRWFARQQPASCHFTPEQSEFYDALTPVVRVFRGGERDRIRGVSWTTSRNVAKNFARGLRGPAVQDPVIATAEIPKEHIFFVNLDRNESETVLDPRRLRKLDVEQYK